MQEKVKELFDIYTLKLEKYEETDDTYRTEIDGIYKEMTSMTDKIKNTAILLTEMHMSYYITLWETRMSMVMLIAFPEVIASYYINCACITCLPEEVCAKDPMKKVREYAEGKMEVPKEIWNVLVDRGPFGVIDYIGQGYADRVQTPQGAASVYGEVQALLEAFVIEKIHGPKIRSTIKTKIKSGINSKIKPKAEVGYGKVVESGRTTVIYGSDDIANYQYNMIENPGPLAEMPNQPAKNFYGGRYNMEVLQEDRIMYRAGNAQNPYGRWFTSEPPASVANVRIDTAVKTHWIDPKTGAYEASSYIDNVYAIKIPKGTTIYTGPVGPQGGVYVGGYNVMQTYIDAPWTFEVVGKTPLQ